ncbi:MULTISPECIES: alpha/beta fold hydrolase [Streptomyces]|uniref:alpha/beta fold hydrolase n=1 Tax=Streptomyces TaxID=1883 RepID=UPI000A80FA24
MSTPPGSPAPTSHKNTPNRSVSVRGVTFVYRRLGPDEGVPLILLNHLSAVLDNWDPRVVDGLAARRPVVTIDNRGVGASGGSTPGALRGSSARTMAARTRLPTGSRRAAKLRHRLMTISSPCWPTRPESAARAVGSVRSVSHTLISTAPSLTFRSSRHGPGAYL